MIIWYICWSQWPSSLKRRSAAARLLRLCVRIPLGTWMSLWCDCCVFSGRGLWDEPITRIRKSYRLWCVVLCDLETSRMRRPWSTLRRSSTRSNTGNVGIRNVETLSCNHCSCGNAIGIIYSENVFFSLGYPICNAHAHAPIRFYNIFPHYLINDMIFRKNRNK
jgi:hypothetical protein